MNVGQNQRRNIHRLCSLLGYSRQAFYQHQKALQLQVLQHDLIISQVRLIRNSQPRVGSRKLLIMLEPFLKKHRLSIGRDAFFALLERNHLLIRARKRRVPRTTFSDHWMHKYPNLIIGMNPRGAGELWVSDITYIAVAEGFSYLSLITDAYSRMIVGYHLASDLRALQCVKALKMALRQLPRGAAPIHHSDRGCQYCSEEYVQHLRSRGIAISMTENSDPRENAIAERVNGILKGELLQEHYDCMSQGSRSVASAIQVYNEERLHSSLGMLTPVEAHGRKGALKKHWKSYHRTKEKEADMQSR
jgi:putative transposase